jgi:hypothetical protein
MMKNISGKAGTAAVLFAALLTFLGCPQYELIEPLDNISVFYKGNERNSVGVEEGQTISLNARVLPSSGKIAVVWEITENGENVAIVSSGEGTRCDIRGIKAGTARIRITAWRDKDDKITKSINVTIDESTVTDIVYSGNSSIFSGEEQSLSAELVPAWASRSIAWSAPVNLTLSGEKITAGNPGPASITATAGGQTRTFNLQVKPVPALSDIAIWRDGQNVSGGSLRIGLYEEIALSAVTTPAAGTFYKWESTSDAVAVDSNGLLRGLRANGTAIIKLSAGGFAGTPKELSVTVEDPVTGIMVKYDNDSNATSLPVSNIVWLAPGEQVKLKIETAGGAPTSITWAGASGEFSLNPSADGANCTITGGVSGSFDAPPVELRITAKNDGNRGKDVTSVVLVKTQARPVWAWDRARDADLNTGLPATLASANNTYYALGGRGTHGTNASAHVWGNGIPYEASGLKLNSSNNTSGKNPAPVGAPGNSTRIVIGSNNRTATSSENHYNGEFDFLEAFCVKEDGVYKKSPDGGYILKPEADGKMIRVSVDYEIVWTAGAGRDLWIMVNNNNANAAFSKMANDSQILIEPLTAARGTRATAVAYLDVWDLVERNTRGLDTLENAFICIIALSNGGSIYVSGVRIEYEY